MSDYVPMRFPEIKPTFRASCTDVARMSTDVEMSNHVAGRHACRMRSGWQVEICKMFASVVALPNGSHWVVSLWAVGEDTAWILDPCETSNSRKKIATSLVGLRVTLLVGSTKLMGLRITRHPKQIYPNLSVVSCQPWKGCSHRQTKHPFIYT